MKHFVILLFITLLSACTNQTERKAQLPVKQPIQKDTSLESYVRTHMPKYRITDTIELRSLNTTLYKAFSGFDANVYTLIKDKCSQQIYKIVEPGWKDDYTFLTRERQLEVLDSKRGEYIEPVSYEYLGLEAFLNQNEILEKKLLSPESVDTILRFHFNNKIFRIGRQISFDELEVPVYGIKDSEGIAMERYFNHVKPILKKKLKSPTVLMYTYGPRSGIILYFDINEGTWACNSNDKDMLECIKAREKRYQEEIKGGYYNIISMRIR